ncbi:nuclear transport factor 2 family protein [Mucilaginibacter sp. HC2]|uniref:nuclear transport factor 2 family protein n=1 Tax=Mucilaginibacter inviolabilis TaxID=2714892 RepID=UPI001407D5F4|nr:nuclear transport factor 2 family protein [Mucilaginibacter inviolabilis]NHA04232.1 nuclear transport factor 2 family protein [Mucilaginibacter inviolabilis]
MKTDNQNNTQPTDDEKLAIANKFITSLKSNDWDTMRSILAADASWTLPGTSLLSGLANGAEAIIKRAQGLKHFGVNFDLKYILIGLNGFTLSLHNTASRGNLLLDEQVAIVFEVNGGKIISMATYLSDVPGINAFFIAGI